MTLRNTDSAYGLVTITLHWAMAALIVFLIALGIYMTRQPDGAEKWQLYDLHKSLGVLTLILVLIRLAWNRFSPLPPLPDRITGRDILTAKGSHVLMYVAMLILPVTGYLDASLGGYHLSVFGLFDVPMLLEKNVHWAEIVTSVHQWTGYALGLLIVGHVVAIIKHQLLRRMVGGDLSHG